MGTLGTGTLGSGTLGDPLPLTGGIVSPASTGFSKVVSFVKTGGVVSRSRLGFKESTPEPLPVPEPPVVGVVSTTRRAIYPDLPPEERFTAVEKNFLENSPEDMWPVNQDSNFGQLRKAICDVLQSRVDYLTILSNEMFAATATDETLHLWEQMLGVAVRPTATGVLANEVLNPSLETNLSYWAYYLGGGTATTWERYTGDSYVGVASARLIGPLGATLAASGHPDSPGGAPVVPGDTVYARGAGRLVSAGGYTPTEIRLYVRYYSNTDVYLGQYLLTALTGPQGWIPDRWTELAASHVVPATVGGVVPAKASPQIYFAFSGTGTDVEAHFDAAQVGVNYDHALYIDGDDEYGRWESTPHGSRSYYVEPTAYDAARRAIVTPRLRYGMFTRTRRRKVIEDFVRQTLGESIALTPAGIPLTSAGVPLYSGYFSVEGLYRIEEDIPNFHYDVLIVNTAVVNQEGIERELDRITPAGITYTISYVADLENVFGTGLFGEGTMGGE